MPKRMLGLLVTTLCLAARSQAAIIVVTNTNDSGAGSLREAINQANTNPGLDEIHFNIPGAGVHTISPLSVLPTMAQPTIVDGYTQPGSNPNTHPTATNAILRIQLDGSNVPPGNAALYFSGGGSTLRGLVVNRWGANGVEFFGLGGNTIRGNFLGTDPTGSTRSENSTNLRVADTGGTVVGGTAPADRNLISGSVTCCANAGISFAAASGTIHGNLIGTDATGTIAIPNDIGISLSGFGGAGVVVGGAGPGERNVISGNFSMGIWVTQNPSNAVIRGNFIGTTADGSSPLGNGNGVVYDLGASQTLLGGTVPAQANLIAHNRVQGIVVTGNAGSGNEIRGNSVHSNAGLGLDIGSDGFPNFNDALDADGGANGFQNTPVLTTITQLAPEGTGGIRIQGKFHSTPSTLFDLDFFANPACSNFPREFLEGQAYMGSTQITTDASGDAVIDVTLGVVTEPNARISATATAPNGNTSEFSQRILYAISPTSGSSTGGIPVTAMGTDFADPTAITVGGVAATGVTFQNDHQLGFTSPARPPGTVHDIVATTPDGTVGTLVKGWVSDFLDVNGAHPFHDFVTRLVSNAITAGVGGGNYGVDQPTLREQMAVFLLLSKNGLCFVPANCVGMFTDVPCSSVYSRWIEGIATAGVTAGCGGGNYCPAAPVTREQMAVFLLRMLEGPTYVPPACTVPTFSDVPCSSGFAIWIEELVERDITAGCGGGLYCPTDVVTRGQMAVFLVATFDIQP